MNKVYTIHSSYSKLIEYSLNVVVRDVTHDHNLLKYLTSPPPTRIIQYLYIGQWEVIHDPIYQPNMWIHKHPIHYYYMDHKSNKVFRPYLNDSIV